MNVLFYFAPPIVFILLCLSFVRWLGSKRRAFNWLTQNAARWLGASSLIGFAMAMLLGILAWTMHTSDIVDHVSLVWPFCIGLMALHGEPSTAATLMVLSLTALENALLYLLLAALVWGFSNWIPRIWRPREEPPSILSR